MLPPWLIKKTPKLENIKKIREILGDDRLHTVCESARCPNLGECFSQKTVTFLILGDVCTRRCRFCAVNHGIPFPPDPDEPARVGEAALRLGLRYVVITSVTRDDLPDGGAEHFALTIQEIKNLIPEVKIEALVPDFGGSLSALKTVLEAGPEVLGHNLETVPGLYPKIRPQSDYFRSLELLKKAKELYPESRSDRDRRVKEAICTKSGLMVGLGERREEVLAVMEDFRAVGGDILTLGQYLRPSSLEVEVEEYIKPEVFEEYQKLGEKMGFLEVKAGPFVRSSYQAEKVNQDVRRSPKTA